MLGAPSDVLLSLAKSRHPADRERLLMAIVTLCETAGTGGDAEAMQAKGLIDDLFLALVLDAEQQVRRRLAERIADADWAPRGLIHILALDDIEIARPVIAASPILQDPDLIRLLVEATLEHQIEVARRPGIGPSVAKAILDQGDGSVLAALAENITAQLPQDGMRRLVEASRRAPGLRAPLARHPALTSELAGVLYAWVGEALRGALETQFRLDPVQLKWVVGEAVLEAKAEPFGRMTGPAMGEDRATMDTRLVEKLDGAGQLKPGYLLRALRERKLPLFHIGLARLAGLELAALRGALDSEHPRLLALACVSAGIDRSVFKTLLTSVRELNAGLPGGGAQGEAEAADVFQAASPKDAVLAFTRMTQAPTTI